LSYMTKVAECWESNPVEINYMATIAKTLTP